ncbi:MAG: choice-of-anchor B family protein [Phycisphaerales bacterium]|nr:choice-of-anchor B family protein [Phycisphaerales bacterium]
MAVSLTAALAILTSVGMAHEDDPKLQDRQSPIGTTAWRKAVDPPMPRGMFDADGEIEMVSWIPLGEFQGNPSTGSDCWGYTSPSGREYALFTHEAGTAVVEITDPDNASIVAEINGPNSLWRDIKVFEHRAYAVSEGGSGIQVINLTNVDLGLVTLEGTVTSGGTAATHNIVLNEDSGFLYRCGGGGNGLRIYDLNANPVNPPHVADWTDRYVHDAQVITWPDDGGQWAGREIAFCCAGYNNGWGETGLTILDVTNKSNIVELSHLQHSNNNYSHQGWLSEDLQYFYLNDELDEQNTGSQTTTRIIDVSNLAAPFQAGTCTSGMNSVDHNLYINGNMMYQANYQSGVRIFDISNRLSPVQVSWFDTYPEGDSAAFNGLWSVYPYFPSGTLIGSDLERGLFVWRLEPPAMSVELLGETPDQLTPAGGDSFDIRVTFAEGVALDADESVLSWADSNGTHQSQLQVISQGNPTVLRALFGASHCGDVVEYHARVAADTGDASAIGHGSAVSADSMDTALDVDFQNSAGWQTSGDATDGQWGVGVPVDCGRGDPPSDFDGSGACALTDNSSASGCNSDVDGGTTVLTSPSIDAAAGGVLSYARWLDNTYGASPSEDSMYVDISDDGGATWTQLEQVGPSGPEASGGWYEVEFDLAGISGYSPSDMTRLRFTVGDLNAGSVVEAAVDAITISSIECDDEACPGDLDGNGMVDVNDILTAVAGFGDEYSVEDILAVLGAFGSDC